MTGSNQDKLTEIILKFYDQTAVLSSDSAKYIQLFQQMYSRFQIEKAVPSVYPPMKLHIQSGLYDGTAPRLILDGVVTSLAGIELDDGYIYENILNTIISRVRSHFLIHAGVISRHGQGIVLVADSAHGKTTLVLELLRRGFQFLSDEMAALGREDRMVHPFPRSLRIRPGTLELTGFPQAGQDAPIWLDKYLLDIDRIKKDCLGPAVSIRHIVIFQNPALKKMKRTIDDQRKIMVVVDRVDDAFLDCIREFKQVQNLQVDHSRTYPFLNIVASHTTTLLSQIEAQCVQRKILLLNYQREETSRPKFDALPRLRPMSKTDAVREMLRRFLGGHKSALLQAEFDGNSLRLYMELAEIVKQASCHQLSVGTLSEMADLVSGLLFSSKSE